MFCCCRSTGLHQSDLDLYVHRHPGSALARLTGAGVEFTQARTPVPSDSLSGADGTRHRRQPGEHGDLLRRLLQSRAAAGGHDELQGATPGDACVPDQLWIAQYGVVYTGKLAKIAEHGGAAPQDRAASGADRAHAPVAARVGAPPRRWS
jgi:hypothetical protein